MEYRSGSERRRLKHFPRGPLGEVSMKKLRWHFASQGEAFFSGGRHACSQPTLSGAGEVSDAKDPRSAACFAMVFPHTCIRPSAFSFTFVDKGTKLSFLP